MTTRRRLPDWEQRLFTFLHSVRNEPLVWGEYDCVIGLAAGAVEAQTGIDLTQDHRGQYSDKRSAMKYLNAKGLSGDAKRFATVLERTMDGFLDRADPLRPHRGNIVLLKSDIGPGFGVRVGRSAVALTTAGLSEFKISPRTREWRPC